MGYDTSFNGAFLIQPPLTDDEIAELNEFCGSRHDRTGPPLTDDEIAALSGSTDLNRQYVGPLDDTSSIGIWCNFEFESGTRATVMRWNGSEKSYDMFEWAQYIVSLLLPAGCTVSGEIEAQGEEPDDHWKMVAAGRTVKMQVPRITWVDKE